MKVLSEYLQWGGWLDGDVVGLHNGALMRVFRVSPKSLDHISKRDRIDVAEKSSSGYRRLQDKYGLHFEESVMPADGYAPEANWTTDASRLLDVEREFYCRKLGQQYESQHYVTVTSKPTPASASQLKRWLFTSSAADKSGLDRDLAEFAQLCAEVKTALHSTLDLRECKRNETAAFLHSTVSHKWQRVDANLHPDLGMMLGSEPFDPHWKVCKLGKQFVQMVVLSGFDGGTHPHALESLSLRFPYRRVTRWLPMSRGEAKGLLVSRQNASAMEIVGVRESLRMGVEKTDNDRKELRDAEKAAQTEKLQAASADLERRGYGYLSTTFVVWGETHKECTARAETLRKAITDCGIICKSETLTTWGTWLGTLPGHLEPGVRKYPLTTRHLADLAPTTRRWGGKAYDHQMEKTCGVKAPWMYTSDPKPFRITTDVKGGGAHTLVVGATGQSGKSTLLGHLGLQFYRYTNAQVISISVGRSELGPCLMSGGVSYQLAAGKSSLAFQPLARIDDPNEMRVASEWLELYLESLGEQVTTQRRQALQNALDLVAKDQPKLRTITGLRKWLKSIDPELFAALKPISREGNYGHIFDGDNAQALAWQPWTMFDIRALLGETIPEWVVEPAIAHLLHLIRGRFTGQPTLLIGDEVQAWMKKRSKGTGERRLVGILKDVLETRRKDNVRAILAAPNLVSIARDDDLRGVILSACATRIYGPDSNAKQQADVFNEFGVSESELDAIAMMQLGSYLHKSEGHTREFDLNAGPIALALTGMSNPEQLEQIEKIHAETKSPDEMTKALMRIKGLELEAKKVLKWKKDKQNAA